MSLARLSSKAEGGGEKEKRKRGIDSREIHTYVAPWPVYSMASSNRSGDEYSYRFAVGSFVEEYANKIQVRHFCWVYATYVRTYRDAAGLQCEFVVSCVQVVQCDEETGNFLIRGVADHPYPATKLLWAPKPLCNEKDLFASTGDYLRLWEVHDEHVSLRCLLDPVRCMLSPLKKTLNRIVFYGGASSCCCCWYFAGNGERVRSSIDKVNSVRR